LHPPSNSEYQAGKFASTIFTSFRYDLTENLTHPTSVGGARQTNSTILLLNVEQKFCHKNCERIGLPCFIKLINQFAKNTPNRIRKRWDSRMLVSNFYRSYPIFAHY